MVENIVSSIAQTGVFVTQINKHMRFLKDRRRLTAMKEAETISNLITAADLTNDKTQKKSLLQRASSINDSMSGNAEFQTMKIDIPTIPINLMSTQLSAKQQLSPNQPNLIATEKPADNDERKKERVREKDRSDGSEDGDFDEGNGKKTKLFDDVGNLTTAALSLVVESQKTLQTTIENVVKSVGITPKIQEIVSTNKQEIINLINEINSSNTNNEPHTVTYVDQEGRSIKVKLKPDENSISSKNNKIINLEIFENQNSKKNKLEAELLQDHIILGIQNSVPGLVNTRHLTKLTSSSKDQQVFPIESIMQAQSILGKGNLASLNDINKLLYLSNLPVGLSNNLQVLAKIIQGTQSKKSDGKSLFTDLVG